MKKVNFKIPSKSRFGKIMRFLGIEINRKWESGYFHQLGYSGFQKNNELDIVIIEKLDGRLITVPNNRYYYLHSTGLEHREMI